MQILEFQQSWRNDFEIIASYINPSLIGTSARIFHVGSTSIPGAIAKPIIDIDIVVRELAEIKNIQEKLESIGYVHQGDFGIFGREAFQQPPNLITHHLYLMQENSKPFLDHLDFKAALIMNPSLLEKYNNLKRSLENLLLINREAYTDSKSEFIRGVLEDYRKKQLK